MPETDFATQNIVCDCFWSCQAKICYLKRVLMSLSLLSDLCEFDSAFLHVVTLELQFSDLEKLNLFQTRVHRGGSSTQELIDRSQIGFPANLSK